MAAFGKEDRACSCRLSRCKLCNPDDIYGMIKAATVAERERIAKQFEDEADRQEKVWNDFLATKQTDKHATTFHTIFRGIAEAIRKGGECGQITSMGTPEQQR